MSIFVAIDFETSDYTADSACALGLVRVEHGLVTREHVRLIRPPRECMRFTHIHGITWQDVREQPTFKELWPEFRPFFEGVDFIAAHNAPFDRGVLRACCEHYGLAMPAQEFKCSLQLARRHFEIYPGKLSNVCRVLGIELNHHEALSDARACAQIFIRATEQDSLPLTF